MTINLGRRLLSNSLWNLVAFVLSAGLGFFSVRIFIQHLGLVEYGLLALLNTLIAPLGLLNFGLGQATTKYVAESLARGDAAGANRHLQNTLMLNVVVGLVGAAIMALASGILATSLFKIGLSDQAVFGAAIRWTAATWAVTQISLTFTAIPTAQQNYRLVSIGTTVFSTISLALSLLVLLFEGGILEIAQVRFAWSICGLIGWGWCAHSSLPNARLLPAYHGAEFRRGLNFGIWQTVAQIGGMAANQADRVLLGVYVSADAVGMFNLPTIFFTTSYNIVSKCAETLFPAFSFLDGAGDRKRLADAVLRAGWLLTLFMVVIQSSLTVFAPDVLRLYMGHPLPPEVAHVLRIFAFVAVLSSPSLVVSQLVLGVGATRWMATTAISSGLVTVLGGMLLVPRFGLAGAAWSDLVAIVATRPIIHFFVWRDHLSTEISAGTFFGRLYGVVLVAAPITIGLTLARNSLSGWAPGWTSLTAGAVVSGTFVVSTVVLVDARRNGRSQGWQDIRRLAASVRTRPIRAGHEIARNT